MQFCLSSLFLLSLVATWVSAAPSPIRKRSFKVERVRNANFVGHNGPKELYKAYSKYSMPLPPGLLDAMRHPKAETEANDDGPKGPDQQPDCPCSLNSTITGTNTTSSASSGSVEATPEDGDIEYLSPVTIGGQTVNLDFDSGSADLWVFNTQLAAKATVGHTLYDPTKSSTFNMLQGQIFSITYGDGSGASGNVGTDVVEIGGVSVPNQAVELATKVTGSFIEDVNSNGLLGLAFSKLNTVQPQQQKTFFENVLPTLAEPVFTADLRKEETGAYEFGRIDNTKFTGDITWIPVNTTNGFWQYGTSSFVVSGGENGTTEVQQATPAQAIADTGTTLMLVAQEVSDAYYSQVSGAHNSDTEGGVVFPCDSVLPDLLIDVGGMYMAKIKGEDVNFAKIRGNTCFGGIQPTTSDLQIWGDIFFKSQFVVFNGGNNTLGMAEHA
ncbi:penicillopepsin [Podospora didyma]|uniref:Penicillopepsin n=1 Tax=Podospora didyma TaxID=330526 RepID=A0AAE0NY39_9PEZI|nr:penicillopepsin [Podospora didyma]